MAEYALYKDSDFTEQKFYELAKGIAKLTINLSVGNYTIESRYNNSTVVNSITVNAAQLG